MKWCKWCVETVTALLICYGVLIFFSALGFSLAEAKPLLDSFWWASVTATTVGYGDIYPVTLVGRTIFFFLTHLTIFIIVPLITARLASTMIVNNDAFTHAEQELIKNKLYDLEKLIRESR